MADAALRAAHSADRVRPQRLGQAAFCSGRRGRRCGEHQPPRGGTPLCRGPSARQRTCFAFEDASRAGYDDRSERAAPRDSDAWRHDVETGVDGTTSGPAGGAGGRPCRDRRPCRPRRRQAPACGDGAWKRASGCCSIKTFLMRWSRLCGLPGRTTAGWPSFSTSRSRAELDAKLRNLHFYPSQIDADTCVRVAEHARRIGRDAAAERLWFYRGIATDAW